MAKVIIGNILRILIVLLTLMYAGLTLFSAYFGIGPTDFNGNPTTIGATVFWIIQIILTLVQLVAAVYLFKKDNIGKLVLVLATQPLVEFLMSRLPHVHPVSAVYVMALAVLYGIHSALGRPPLRRPTDSAEKTRSSVKGEVKT